MYQDPLRFWAIASQATGFFIIVALETLLGRAQAGAWQIWVLVLMLMAALVIALLRRYQTRRWMKQQAERRQVLEQAREEEPE